MATRLVSPPGIAAARSLLAHPSGRCPRRALRVTSPSRRSAAPPNARCPALTTDIPSPIRPLLGGGDANPLQKVVGWAGGIAKSSIDNAESNFNLGSNPRRSALPCRNQSRSALEGPKTPAKRIHTPSGPSNAALIVSAAEFGSVRPFISRITCPTRNLIALSFPRR